MKFIPTNFRRTNLIISIIAIVTIAIASVLFENHRQMAAIFTVPFFSGAANTGIGQPWQCAPEEVSKYKLLSTEQKESYKFSSYPPSSLINYNHYNAGFVYLIIVAKQIFFWKGDIQALKAFHVLMHIIICLLIISVIERKTFKFLFLLCYGLNPLVIYFVTFPYLYFWQVLPSFAIAVVLLQNKPLRIGQFLLLATVCALAFVVRPTVILAVLFLFFLLFTINKRYTLLVSLTGFLTVFLWLWTPAGNKTIWHTAYVGIGAYENPYMQGVTDNNAFALFKKKTGQNLYLYPGGNYYDSTTFAANVRILKTEYLKIAKQIPLLLLRNAFLNFFQGFSIGYLLDYPMWTNYLSMAAGLVFFILLVINRLYKWIIAIALTNLSFSVYFPPIPAYMFGSYLLLVSAFIVLLQKNADTINNLTGRIKKAVST